MNRPIFIQVSSPERGAVLVNAATITHLECMQEDNKEGTLIYYPRGALPVEQSPRQIEMLVKTATMEIVMEDECWRQQVVLEKRFTRAQA